MKTNADRLVKRPEVLLREAAASYKQQWPGMSLRAVAGRLKISPSYWSKILRGEKPFPQHLLPAVVKTLGLDAQQVAQLQRSILETIEQEQLAPATGIRVSRAAQDSPVETYRNLGREDFWILEEWYYIPVLNLFTLTGFKAEEAEISERLGLRAAQVTEAVRRLRQHGFLVEAPDGKLERTDLQVRFPTDRSFAAVRKYHETMLKKAREEVSSETAAESFNSRLIAAVCFAGSSEKMKEARLILEEAMYRAANVMADEPVSDEVYQLNVQIFPLTRGNRKGKRKAQR